MSGGFVPVATVQGECTYIDGASVCRQPAVGELRSLMRYHGPWLMCECHIQPKMHPPDLHKKLIRWRGRFRA